MVENIGLQIVDARGFELQTSDVGIALTPLQQNNVY